MTLRRSAIASLAILVLAAVGSAAASFSPPPWVFHGRYSPAVDPANFVSRIDNRYFPLVPGTAFHYRG
jgi:hypothetical protein